MPFQLPNNNSQKQIEILTDIKSSVIALHKRLDNLEANNSSTSSVVDVLDSQIQKIGEDTINATKKIDRLYSYSLLCLIIAVIFSISSIIFAIHMWDVPAQTNAINQYIYIKSVKENSFYSP